MSDDIPDLVRERAFQAVADYFERLHRPPFTISQSVSIARALRPYVEQEGRRRKAHGGTAPGRRSKAKPGVRFSSREFIARCVGLAPATLCKAEKVIAAAERDPRWRKCVMAMDEKWHVGRAFRAITGDAFPPVPTPWAKQPAGRKFGEQFVKGLIEGGLGALSGAERFGTKKRKRPEASLPITKGAD